MEHEQVISEALVEKYLLHELSTARAEEFEAHAFECPACAEDLRITAEFIDRTRRELSTGAHDSVPKTQERSGRDTGRPWFASFWSPQIVVPAMAVLLSVVLYQNILVIPRLAIAHPAPEGPQVIQTVSLIGANSRDGSHPELRLQHATPVLLTFDIPTATQYSEYVCELLGPDGRIIWQLPVTVTQAQDTVSVHVPAVGWEPGQYTLRVRGQKQSAPAIELARYPFDVHKQE